MFEKLKSKILAYVFYTSKRPILFSDLLYINKLFNEGMLLDVEKLGARMRLSATYIVFLLLWHIIIFMPVLIFHSALAKMDCHLSVLFAVLFTAIFFATFSIYKEWLIDEYAKQRIKNSWSTHFPYFTYEEYNHKVSTIYEEALKLDIPKKELEKFVMDKLVESE
jgi:hypothetical protein